MCEPRRKCARVGGNVQKSGEWCVFVVVEGGGGAKRSRPLAYTLSEGGPRLGLVLVETMRQPQPYSVRSLCDRLRSLYVGRLGRRDSTMPSRTARASWDGGHFSWRPDCRIKTDTRRLLHNPSAAPGPPLAIDSENFGRQPGAAEPSRWRRSAHYGDRPPSAFSPLRQPGTPPVGGSPRSRSQGRGLRPHQRDRAKSTAPRPGTEPADRAPRRRPVAPPARRSPLGAWAPRRAPQDLGREADSTCPGNGEVIIGAGRLFAGPPPKLCGDEVSCAGKGGRLGADHPWCIC